MRPWVVGGGALLVLAMVSPASPGASDELRTLVEAERSFAQTAARQGIRDAFLEYFAPDSVALVPHPRSAIALLRERQSRPPAEEELTWEPRTGDVAESGELGWLTGPSTYIDRRAAAPPRYGNYLSIWRRKSGGPWRVYLDFGTRIPAPAPFDAGFAPARLPRRYASGGNGAADGVSLADADAAMNARIGWDGLAKAYAPAVAPDRSRLHRQGVMPQVGRAAIAAWLEQHNARWSFKTAATGAARSGDLGYSYGSYGAGRYRGGYVRIWARDASGRWWLMADAATAG